MCLLLVIHIYEVANQYLTTYPTGENGGWLAIRAYMHMHHHLQSLQRVDKQQNLVHTAVTETSKRDESLDRPDQTRQLLF